MNDTRSFERAVSSWLDDGTDVTSPEIIDAVLLADQEHVTGTDSFGSRGGLH